jgi:hypothetical protein
MFGGIWNDRRKPSCKTIQKTSAGYPSLVFGGLNLCNPDDKCDNVKWPMQYGKQPEYYKFSPSKPEMNTIRFEMRDEP